jgi:hypothetical protein
LAVLLSSKHLSFGSGRPDANRLANAILRLLRLSGAFEGCLLSANHFSLTSGNQLCSIRHDVRKAVSGREPSKGNAAGITVRPLYLRYALWASRSPCTMAFMRLFLRVIFGCCFLLFALLPARADEAKILTDQVGYEATGPKHAVILGRASDEFTGCTLNSASDHHVVFSVVPQHVGPVKKWRD